MTRSRETYEKMESRLAEVEGLIDALRKKEVDAIVGDRGVMMIRQREVEEAARRAKADLERRVEEYAADLARANQRLQEAVEEQTQNRRRLEEAQRRLLQTQRIAHLGNWEWDPKNDKAWWSDEVYRLFGVEPGQMEPNCETFLSFVHPEDRTRIGDTIDRILGNKRPESLEFRIVRPDGQERHISKETEVVLDPGGDVARLLGVICDLTEFRRAQEQLERTACQLGEQAELLDLAHDMIFVHDMEGRIVFWNRGAERCYGWKKEEALGRLSHQLLRTEYCEPFIRITAQIIRDGWWEGELTHTTRDGRKVTVATRWALRSGPDARPISILEIDNDITARKQAEQKMVEARHLAESIVDTIRESLVVLDSQLRVVSANRFFREAFGLTEAQVQGRFILTLHGGLWDRPDLRDRFQDLLTRGIGFEGLEVECDLPSGPRTLVLSARPVQEQVAEAGLVLLVMQDVTEFRRQEQEIRTDKQQLASLAEELMQVEDRHRGQTAQTLRDSVGECLTQIGRNLDALPQEDPAALRESLRRVREQLTNAIEWTRNLTVDLNPSSVYSQGLTEAIRGLAEQFSDSEGFLCCVRGGDEPIPAPPQVCTLLYRVVRELLVNVARHAKANNVEITLEYEGGSIRISVEDDGRGVSPSTGSAGGIEDGQGIRNIRERLTRIGGELIIRSAEGRGTRVTVVAPAKFD
jgi:PAS domain S-box-containing protein